jgi:hypothetical protein
MPRKTFVAGEVLLAQDVNQFLMDQTVMNFASDAARSSAIPTPTEGMLALSKDTQQINYYNGSAFVPALPIGAWESWAPTLSSGWANGNGTWVAAYAQLGKTVFVRGQFTLGSTTTKGSILSCSLPVNSKIAAPQFIFPCNMVAGGTRFYGVVRMGGTGVFSIDAQNAASTYVTNTSLTATIPGTWVTGDKIDFCFSYEGV